MEKKKKSLSRRQFVRTMGAAGAFSAAAIAFARYRIGINSTELVNRLRDEKSVLIVPGDHFGLDRHLRISYGLSHDYLRDGLDRIHQMLVELEKAGVGA